MIEDRDFHITLNVAGICSINREEWIITDLALNLLGITSVPLYETLGLQMLILILKQTEMTTLFGSTKSLANILSLIERKDHHLKQLVCFDTPSPALSDLCLENEIHLLHYHDLM